MKIKRRNFEMEKLFTPGVRMKLRNGFEVEVVDTFHGVIAMCPQTAEIFEQKDFNKFACHNKYRGNDIVEVYVKLSFEEEACPIDELEGSVLLTALDKYREYIGFDGNNECLYKHAKLMRVWFNTEDGSPLCEEGFDFEKADCDDFKFMKKMESIINK